MTVKTRRLIARVLVLPALLLTGAARADEGPRPFTLVVNGNADPVPTEDPCVLINTETGTGFGSPVGIVKWESKERVNFCSDPEGAEIEGEFVLTTWNRDQIRGRYRTLGQADPETSEITVIGRYEITSGTGRFASVAGKGVIAAAGSLSPPFPFNGGLFGRVSF
jgi:hypothetical protein